MIRGGSNSSCSTGGSGVGGGSKRKLEELQDGGGGLLKTTDVKKAKLETKALKAKRPGFTDERYNETSYYQEPENGKTTGET